ncbi:DUF4149 domain-containing protein [Dinoroseobacter sp. PD6]|uniref:DUF4149 domain-containing protein n=1 Tax=Dinoroseobacter sp. PD6 TaxID=3028384 RepID=UPI00237AD731|nr:DUF4149 domain-containing protein [Dinoroseobacter sp. PD6]MDD9718831.1 DUF4149 domain-containing protein [Dinoroseobacter sp. PD6]
MTDLVLLMSATLLGGMVFYSFGFAPVLFAQLPMDRVRPLLRGTFPYYYLAVIGLSAVTAVAAWFVSPLAAGLFATIALSTVYARQILMAQINAATDRGDKRAFGMLHGLSVVIQLVQIGLAGWAVVLIG